MTAYLLCQLEYMLENKHIFGVLRTHGVVYDVLLRLFVVFETLTYHVTKDHRDSVVWPSKGLSAGIFSSTG